MIQSDNHNRKAVFWPGRISALLPLLLFAWFASQIPEIAAGKQMVIALNWVPSLGVEFSFVLDGLNGLFALIITAVGALVMIYADAYMAGHAGIGRFYFYLHAFMLAMLGLVLSDNLVMLYVFWELTTLFSFLLIGFEHESAASRASARQALLVTGGGGLALLVGILLIGQTAGTYSLSELARAGELLRQHTAYIPILMCLLAGAFTKSAQVPFHFWLPAAMTAPTPISAFLHSATMVKAGIYLLARMHPFLGGTMVWMSTLVLVGAATAVWGAVLAMGQTDLKRILAYTTIMALGTITMFLGGIKTPTLTAAVTFLLVHALYKSALFLVVGAIDHQTGTRQIDRIGGIGRSMPFTAAAGGMAALSMAGFPLFLGFIGKEIMYKGALTEEVFPQVATGAALAANALMTAVAATLALRPFWGKPRDVRPAGETPWQMWCGPLLLGGTGLMFGLISDAVGRWLIDPAVLAFHPTTETVQLKLFYGFNEPLLLSMLTLCLGGLVYWERRIIRRNVNHLLTRLPVTMAGVYDELLDAVIRVAGWQTRVLQNGSLFRYLVVIVGTIFLVVGWALSRSVVATGLPWSPPTAAAWQWIVILLMLVSAGVVVRSASSLSAICAMGVVGAGVALIFLSYGAPDVALTQLLVETLTLIIAAIVLLRLPRMHLHPGADRTHRVLSQLAATVSGLLTAGLLIAVRQHELDRSITTFYEQASYLQAHGRNIVNVILVDFRSLDTLGEIIVVAASALAALALIRGRRASS